jgi:hypothetical protein
MARRTSGIEDIAAQVEQFGQRIKNAPGLEIRPCVLKPSSLTAIAAVERKLGLTLPDDVKAFLRRGLKGVEGSIQEPFASIGFDFLDARQTIEHTRMLREVAADLPDGDAHARVIRSGIALTHEEPELVFSRNALYHFSFRNPLLKIAGSFSEFLRHYLAAGCFSTHDFCALWKVVSPHVPIAIPPAKNVWVRAYQRQFPNL